MADLKVKDKIDAVKVAYINPPDTLVDESLKPKVIKKPDSVNHCRQDDNSQ